MGVVFCLKLRRHESDLPNTNKRYKQEKPTKITNICYLKKKKQMNVNIFHFMKTIETTDLNYDLKFKEVF
jgi:hypothetical protein